MYTIFKQAFCPIRLNTGPEQQVHAPYLQEQGEFSEVVDGAGGADGGFGFEVV